MLAVILLLQPLVGCEQTTGRFGLSHALIFGQVRSVDLQVVADVEILVSALDVDCATVIAGAGSGRSSAAGAYRVEVSLIGLSAATRCVRVLATPPQGSGLAAVQIDTVAIFGESQRSDSTRIDITLALSN